MLISINTRYKVAEVCLKYFQKLLEILSYFKTEIHWIFFFFFMELKSSTQTAILETKHSIMSTFRVN